MPDYSNGKIYKIHSYQTDLVYYGSTTQALCRRFSKHKSDIKRGIYIATSNQIIQLGDAMITLIELFPCGSKSELEARERFYIENNQCVNRVIPTRTHKEWQEANREKISQQNKAWHEANRDNRKARDKANREKISQQNKAWSAANRKKISHQRKKYCEANRTHIKQYDQHRNSPFGSLCKTYGIFN